MAQEPKSVKSFRLSEDVVANLNQLVSYYQQEQWKQGFRNKVSAANVIEVLVNKELKTLLKGENN